MYATWSSDALVHFVHGVWRIIHIYIYIKTIHSAGSGRSILGAKLAKLLYMACEVPCEHLCAVLVLLLHSPLLPDKVPQGGKP